MLLCTSRTQRLLARALHFVTLSDNDILASGPAYGFAEMRPDSILLSSGPPAALFIRIGVCLIAEPFDKRSRPRDDSTCMRFRQAFSPGSNFFPAGARAVKLRFRRFIQNRLFHCLDGG